MVWKTRSKFRRNLAVVIGIDRYENERIRDLSTPVNDASAIADLLETDYAYKQESLQTKVIRLFNKQATLTGIRNLLTKTLPELQMNEGDRLIFYFAGHGLPCTNEDGPEGYLVPQDADLTKPNSFLPMREVAEELDKLACHHLLLILDCCFAGTFHWASPRRDIIPVLKTIHQEHYYRFIRYPAWHIITSSAHDQEALDVANLDVAKLDQNKRDEEKKLGYDGKLHSPFALALLKGLQHNEGTQQQNADLIADGVVTAHELFTYLEQQVSELSKNRQTPGHYPRRDYDKGQFIFTSPKFDPKKRLEPAPKLNEENNPYRGLKSFDEKHAQFFFGRQVLVEALVKRLCQPKHTLQVVLGVSGSGKSSLVKAGLLPRLRVDKSPWYILEPMRPQASPFMALARVLLPVVNPTLIEQLAQVSFLDKKLKQVVNQPDQKTDSPNQATGSTAATTDPLKKAAANWGSAQPEAKLLLIEDYFAQLEALCSSEELRSLTALHQAVLSEIDATVQQLQQNRHYLSQEIQKWSQAQPNTTLLLVIDQFEELITMSQNTATENRGTVQTESNGTSDLKQLPFLEMLREAIATCPQQWRVVVTLRSDFEPRFLDSSLQAYWQAARFPVRAMNSDELRQAIEGPALKQALYFEPDKLVGMLIDEVGQMPGALPLLSFTLSELYVKLHERWTNNPESTDRALRIKDYEELGGVAAALTRRATEEYESQELNDLQRATMRRVMLRMVTIEGGGVARRRVPESELVYTIDEENQRVKVVVNRLVKARLLVKGQEIGDAYVEPAHDFLVRSWDKLQKWIKASQGNILLQKDLTSAATRWISSRQEKQSSGYLWDDDPRLPLAKQLIEQDDDWLNIAETEFVQESVKRRRGKRNRVIKITSGVITALSGLTLFAFIQLQLSILREKAALVGNLLPTTRAVDGLVLAIEATGKSQSILKPLLQSVFNSTIQSQLMRAVQVGGERSLLLGHSGAINCVAFSPNGQYIASASEDGTVRLWNLQGEQIGKPLQGHDRTIKAVAFSPDSKLIVTGGSNREIQLWNLQGQLLEKISQGNQTTSGEVTSVVFTANGRFIISGTSDGTGYLWDRQEQQVRTLFQNQGGETHIDISQNGQYMVVGVLGKGVRIFDFQKNALSKPLQKHKGLIESVSISSDGQHVVSSNAFEVTLTDREGNEEFDDPAKDFRPQPFQGDEGGIGSAKISPDGRFIIASNQGIRSWNQQGQQIGQPLQGHLSLVSALAFSPDGQLIVSGGIDGTVRVWDFQSLAVGKPFQGQADPIVSFSSDGKYIISRGYDTTLNTRTIQLLDMQGSPIGKPLLGFDMSPDRSMILSDRDGTVRLWNLRGEAVSPTFPSNSYSFSFSPDGQLIFSSKEDRSLQIWNRQGHLISNSKPFSENQDSSVLAFSHNNQFVALSGGEDKTLRLWNLQGDLIGTPFQGHEDRVIALAFSPDNQFIASGSEDRSIRLWNKQGKAIASPFIGHRNEVSAVAISSDSQLIASGSGVMLSRGRWFSADNTVRLWDKQGNPIGEPLQGHTGRVISVAFSTDRRFMVSSSNDDTVRIWRTGWQGWLEVACNRLRYHPVLRNPQTEEQRQARNTCQQQVWQHE